MNIHKFWFPALVFCLITTGHAFAHKVIIFAWVEDGMIYTESRFASKRKAKNAAIIVVNEKEQVVHKGQTDAEGKYAFNIPKNIDSDLIIELEAGSGHKNQWRISREELVKAHSVSDIQSVIEKKENLEQGPSFLKIMGGIGIIFLLALAVRFFKRKKN